MDHTFPLMKRLPMYPLKVSHPDSQNHSDGMADIDLGMGNPDLPPADHIVDELIRSMQQDTNHRYAPSSGVPSLKKGICEWYQDRYGVTLDPDTQSIVTIGSKEGIAHLAMATVSSGDSVIVPDPTYPVHAHAFTIAGATVNRVPLINPDDFLQRVRRLIATAFKKPKLILVNFPANPTGMCVDLQFYTELVAIAREHSIWLVQDFAYADIAFDDYVPPSILQVEGAKDVAVEFFSLSKSYNMAGFRVGFMCGNSQLVQALTHIKSYLDYGIYRPIQSAAQVALQGPQNCVKTLAHEYQCRRDTLCHGLRRLGWEVDIPKATMFVWAKIPDLYQGIGSEEFTRILFDETRVTATAGRVFGLCGEGYVRFSLVANTDEINTALGAIYRMMQLEIANQKYSAYDNLTALGGAQ